MIAFILSFVLTASNMLHVDKLAEYYISEQDGIIQMKVVLEKEEMMSLDFKPECDVKKMTALCLANHIRENLSVEINNNTIHFELGDSYTEHGHLVLFFSGELKNQQVTSLNIINDSFYEFYADYRNRIILDLDQFQSSYLLTAGKNSISE